MFGRKSKKQGQVKTDTNTDKNESAKKIDLAENTRQHIEVFGQLWLAMTGMKPKTLIPQVVSTVLTEGGTRKAWQWKALDKEFVVMAWPQDQPIRACVIMSGKEGEQLRPVTAIPLVEGLPNDLEIEKTYPHSEGYGADVGVNMVENSRPMWFFDPFYRRDMNDLTPGVTQTFYIGAIATACRKALLDHITLTQGPVYEEYAQKWLQENPDKHSKDVPPLKFDIAGKHFIMPGNFYSEYHLRAPIERIEEYKLEKMAVKVFYLSFPFDNRPALQIPLYVSDFVLNGYTPQEGDEIEAYVSMQGRVIDFVNSDD